MAKPSRRSVLRTGLLLAAGTAPLGLAEKAVSAVSPGDGLRRSSFLPQLRKPFLLAAGDKTYRAVLVDVADLRAAPRGHDQRFGLLFKVRSAPEAGIYTLKHWTVRDTELFVSPIGGKGLYEVIVDAVVPGSHQPERAGGA